MIRYGLRARLCANSIWHTVIGVSFVNILMFAGAAQSYAQSSPKEIIKQDPVVWLEQIPGQVKKPEKIERKFLSLDLGNAGNFEQIESLIIGQFGEPNEEFSGESVWFVDSEYAGPNTAKYMTVQLKNNKTGQLVLIADARLASERGGPLIVGPANAMVRKARPIRKKDNSVKLRPEARSSVATSKGPEF